MAGDSDFLFASGSEANIISRASSSPQMYSANSNNELLNPPQTSPPMGTTCGFLATLPSEVRDVIYKQLLVNPALSDSGSSDSHFLDVTYGLSPTLLYTSRQIYKKASKILYGCNTFYMTIIGASDQREGGRLSSYTCPLFRNVREEQRRNITEYSSLPTTVARVARWKVVVAGGNPYRGCINTYLATQMCAFCRAISKVSLVSLELLIVPRVWEEEDKNENETLDRFLAPLKLLRNVQAWCVTFRDAEIHEMHPHLFRCRNPQVITFVSQMPPRDILEELKTLVQGNKPVEFAFNMFSYLIRYAQAFERHDPFKMDMDLDMWTPGGVDLAYASGFYVPFVYRQHGNPVAGSFWSSMHPVEAGLHKAKLAAGAENGTEFKNHRLLILQYLEPQYQRVRIAYNGAIEFIEQSKRLGGLLDATVEETSCVEYNPGKEERNTHAAAKGIVVLEELA